MKLKQDVVVSAVLHNCSVYCISVYFGILYSLLCHMDSMSSWLPGQVQKFPVSSLALEAIPFMGKRHLRPCTELFMASAS